MNRILLFLLFAYLTSCKKIEVKDPEESPSSPLSSSYRVYINNEGNFQAGNSSITSYDPLDGEVIKDRYFQANNANLGDVCQSITVSAGKAYIIVNNSSKIEVVNSADLKKINTITQLISPRYMVINGPLGFVSDLYANEITVMNIVEGTVIKKIPLKGWTEEMLLDGSNLYVTNLSTSYLYRIDINSLTLKDSLQIGYSSGSIVKDADNKLWVLCQGDQFSAKPAEIYKINSSDFNVIQKFGVPDGSVKLRIDNTGNTLYFLGNGVNRFSKNETWNGAPWIASAGNNFYGLGIDPFTNDVYVADAHLFNEEGTIYHYTSSGTLVRTFKSGINPGGFSFF